jgi:hypothetical protein
MAEEKYIPRVSDKRYEPRIPDSISPFRVDSEQPLKPKGGVGGGLGKDGPAGADGEDGEDGQDGAQTGCAGQCAAYYS